MPQRPGSTQQNETTAPVPEDRIQGTGAQPKPHPRRGLPPLSATNGSLCTAARERPASNREAAQTCVTFGEGYQTLIAVHTSAAEGQPSSRSARNHNLPAQAPRGRPHDLGQGPQPPQPARASVRSQSATAPQPAVGADERSTTTQQTAQSSLRSGPSHSRAPSKTSQVTTQRGPRIRSTPKARSEPAGHEPSGPSQASSAATGARRKRRPAMTSSEARHQILRRIPFVEEPKAPEPPLSAA